MLNVTQRIDLMKLSVDLAKAEASVIKNSEISLATTATEIFAVLKAVLEDGSVLDDTDIGDVKSVVDVASSLESLID